MKNDTLLIPKMFSGITSNYLPRVGTYEFTRLNKSERSEAIEELKTMKSIRSQGYRPDLCKLLGKEIELYPIYLGEDKYSYAFSRGNDQMFKIHMTSSEGLVPSKYRYIWSTSLMDQQPSGKYSVSSVYPANLRWANSSNVFINKRYVLDIFEGTWGISNIGLSLEESCELGVGESALIMSDSVSRGGGYTMSSYTALTRLE